MTFVCYNTPIPVLSISLTDLCSVTSVTNAHSINMFAMVSLDSHFSRLLHLTLLVYFVPSYVQHGPLEHHRLCR